MSAVWVFQFCFLMAAAAVALLWPGSVLYFLDECVTIDEPCFCDEGANPPVRYAPRDTDGAPCKQATGPGAGEVTGEPCPTAKCGSCTPPPYGDKFPCIVVRSDAEAQGLFVVVRLFSPFLLTFALFSMYAAMREDERVRRSMSFVFAFIYVVMAVLLYTDDFSAAGLRQHILPRALLAVLLTLAVFAVQSVFVASDRVQRAVALLVLLGYALAAAAQALVTTWAPPSALRQYSLYVAGLSALLFVFDALINSMERMRARLFYLVLLFPIVLAALDTVQQSSSNALGKEPLAIRAFMWLVVFCVLVHALYAVWPMEDAERRMSGSANTRPTALWVLWLGQGLMSLAIAVVLTLRETRETVVLRHTSSPQHYHELFEHLRRVVPALFAAIGFFSFTGMQASREWVWKAHCAIFATFYASLLLCGLLVWNSQLFEAWVPLAGFLPLSLFGIHLFYYRSRGEWFSEEVGEGPDGWTMVDLVLGPLLLLGTLRTRRRARNARGVAARGTLRVLPRRGELYPEHDFFKEREAEMRLQIRFSNERSSDDAAADARGAALHIEAPDLSSFDLLLSTGAYSGAENLLGLGLIAALQGLGRRGRALLARSQQILEGGIAALRRAPASYTRLRYYSQLVRFWVSEDSERYLVRYRLIPISPDEEESGLPVARGDFLKPERSPAEHRPADYLRAELKMRIEGEREVLLLLQAQFHQIKPGDALEWYNPGADWHAGDHPWIDLAEVTLKEVLDDEEAERLFFNPGNAPPSLGTPVSTGVLDHRSIADSQRRVMRRVQSIRRWMVRAFGLPSSAPEAVALSGAGSPGGARKGFAGQVRHAPRGTLGERLVLWIHAYGFAWALVIWSSIVLRRRMSHNAGVVASGKLRIDPDPRIPPHDFFTPGRELRCRVRHAPVSWDDETIIQVRSASLKFADSTYESPLDIEMNTGRYSFFWNGPTWFKFVSAREVTFGRQYRAYYAVYPDALAAKDGLRLNPASFSQLYYHSQVAQYFIGKDGVKRYVKFRLIPFDRGPESGLVAPEDLERLWDEEVIDESLSPNYLSNEYIERASRGPVKYWLQLQLHTPEPNEDTQKLLNCNKEWDPEDHPFMDVALVEIDKALSWEEECRMVTSIANSPPSLALIPAKSMEDNNAINYFRASSDIGKRARLFAYRLFNKLPTRQPDVRKPTAKAKAKAK